MKRFTDLVAACLPQVPEIFPWDLRERLDRGSKPILLDVREPYEFAAMHIEGSINIPRGILESACEYGYEETVPEIVTAREREIVVICRSGFRSVLSAFNMQQMGYGNVCSLKTGLRGWNDFEQPMINSERAVVDIDTAEEYFRPKLRPEQIKP
jgi:rhodanese-related sulfurtransferase